MNQRTLPSDRLTALIQYLSAMNLHGAAIMFSHRENREQSEKWVLLAR